MCGIVGFIGGEQAAPILLEGLSRLEYRGYDSAGLAVYDPHKGLQVSKAKGRLKALYDLTHGGADVKGTMGVGHTRWATHGEPNDINSHPQVSQSGRVAVVHNGIIENYLRLKEFLTEQGVRFVSDTDTEVVAQLVDYYYKGDLLDAVAHVLKVIEGAYALGIVCADEPDKLVAARKDAPLLLGYGEGCNFLASDVTALVKYTRNVSYMEDGEVAVLTREGIQCYDSLMRPVRKEISRVEWEIDAAEKGGYPHFMLKEIMEQPDALRRCISPRIKAGEVYFQDFPLAAEEIRAFKKLYIVACGSSYHVGMVGKYNLERLLRLPVEVALASEFRYMDPIVDGNTLVIVISQSGETLDTMAALREARRLGAKVLSIVNVVGSSIARESDVVLYTWAGPEIAVATTKAYSTQLIAQYLLAMKFAKVRGTVSQNDFDAMIQSLERLPEQISLLLSHKENVQRFANRYLAAEHVFFIGRGIDYAISMEGSLKLKEISYIHSEAYAAGELKHGTISLIEDGRLVVAVLTQPELYKKTISNIQEVKTRGAFVMAVTTVGNTEVEKVADYVVYLPETNPIFANSLAIIPLQLFGYYVSIGRGLDVDKPRNLAKSVTVE